MNRRLFAQLLFASPFTIPAMANASAQLSTSTLIQTSPLAGFQYYVGERLWGKIRQGDSLNMLRESSNPYDKRAVALLWNDHKIGYIPRRDNAAVAQMLDLQMPLQASISRLKESDDPWERVSLNVELLQS